MKYKIMEEENLGGSHLDEDGNLQLLPGVQLLRNVRAAIRVKLEDEADGVVVGINFYDDDRQGDDATETFWFEQTLDREVFAGYAMSLPAFMATPRDDVTDFFEEAIADMAHVSLEIRQESFHLGTNLGGSINQIAVVFDVSKSVNPRPDLELILTGPELRRLLSFLEITRWAEFEKYYKQMVEK